MLDTPNDVVLGSGRSPGSSDLLNSAGDSPADGTSTHPLSVSDGSSVAGSEYEDGADEDSTDSPLPAPVKSSGKSRLRRSHSQSEDEVEDDDSDNVPLSSLRSSISVPRGKMQSYLQAGRKPPGPFAESDDSGGNSEDGSGARSSLTKRQRKHKHKHQHRSLSPVPVSRLTDRRSTRSAGRARLVPRPGSGPLRVRR
ncbi:hypothetical protein PR002_g12462 [Phytophthora rubi]|uniref:Uncharacterized protein n=1 Tax=Phytophthora rubi TaxID=129364 RepID=A0A6A3LXJ8_9STRA|nr:hypothetical protein PR002_g12462 [Phytophthora rubi]